MTQVCLVGDDDVNLRYELLSRETSREALATYDLREPYENTVALETVSLGAAVAVCNDLDWYLVRFATDALVFDPSVSESEWLSRSLATAIRDDAVDPTETGRYLKVYGVEYPESDFEGEQSAETDASSEGAADSEDPEPGQQRPPRLVEPMLVARTGETIPEYDIRDVEETLVVRLTEAEFDA
jgi:hypothetical protein